MPENKKYIGITIGPIFDMMSLVSTPAALCATSYMFSSIAKKTCEKLSDNKYTLISPYYDPENSVMKKQDGVGLFNDRIFIEADENDIDSIIEIKNAVLEEVGEAFGVGKDELKKRVLFVIAVIEIAEGENLILKGGKILDSLELSRKVMFEEQGNPIINNFTGALLSDSDDRRLSKNDAVKKIVKAGGMDIDTKKWILLNDEGNIKSLPDIADSVGDLSKKKYRYYAVVRSDGDYMSKIIEKLDQIKDRADLSMEQFSKTCLEYCGQVTDKVIEYKGMPIYSSGDDLLAIMPCDSGNGKTVFDFVKEVNGVFAESFRLFIDMINDINSKAESEKDKIELPSLSFGITICYNHFPLYEALEDSAYLLFELAKKSAGKNCTVVRLQKHSGQSEGLVIYNDFLDKFIDFQKKVLAKDTDTVNNIFVSALYKTEQFQELFKRAVDKANVDNLFNNTFDAVSHKDNEFVHKTLPEFYFDIMSKKRLLSLSESGLGNSEDCITAFNFVLRMMKFFVEKAGKEGDSKNE